MKVLLINGSPRSNGCTYAALNEVAGELKKSGMETEIVSIGKEPIRGCTACRKCFDDSGRCVFDDDMVNRCLEKMETADGLVIGSPVYYASANGAMVSLLDRMFFAGRCFAYKPGAAVVSARRAGTTAALEVLNKYIVYANMPLVPSSYWNMVHGQTPEEVRQDEEGLYTMRNLGKNMAWLLRCIEGQPLPLMEEKKPYTNFIR